MSNSKTKIICVLAVALLAVAIFVSIMFVKAVKNSTSTPRSDTIHIETMDNSGFITRIYSVNSENFQSTNGRIVFTDATGDEISYNGLYIVIHPNCSKASDNSTMQLLSYDFKVIAEYRTDYKTVDYNFIGSNNKQAVSFCDKDGNYITWDGYTRLIKDAK